MTSLALAAVLQTSILAAGPAEFDAAAARSMQTGRPVLVLLGAEWCPACKVMRDRTLPAVARQGGLDHVEFVYLDVDKHRELARKLIRGGSIPQLIRLQHTAKGWQGQYLIGGASVARVTAFAAPPEQRVQR